MKEKLKTTAIDDGAFNREKHEKTRIIATITQGPNHIEKVKSTTVEIDGDNATQKITQLANKPSIQQTNLILIHGTTVAGFNIIDTSKIYKDLKKPIITVLREKPNQEKIKKALKNTKNTEKKMKKIKNNPKYKKHKNIYYTAKGIEQKEAEKTLDKLTIQGNLPEPLRITHTIARGITHEHR